MHPVDKARQQRKAFDKAEKEKAARAEFPSKTAARKMPIHRTMTVEFFAEDPEGLVKAMSHFAVDLVARDVVARLEEGVGMSKEPKFRWESKQETTLKGKR